MTVRRSIAVATILVVCVLTTANAGQPRKEDSPLKDLVERLGSGDATIRKQAAEALQSQSSDANAGLNRLNEPTGDDDSPSLERFRKEARPLVPALVKLLQSPYEES